MARANRRRIYVWYFTLIGFCGTYFFIQVLQLGVNNSVPVEDKLKKLEYYFFTENASTKSPENTYTESFESSTEERTTAVSTLDPPKPTETTKITTTTAAKLVVDKVNTAGLKDGKNIYHNISASRTPTTLTVTTKKAKAVKKRKVPPNLNYFKSIKDPKQHTEIVNPHEFKFLMHPKDICKMHPKLYVLSVVHSAPNNTLNRDTIRETWGSKSLYPKFRILTLFFLGTSDDANITRRMHNESMVHGDMVIQDYHDSYRNLTYKAMSWLQWTTTYCPNISFVLKTDDDAFVNLVQFTKLMKRYEKALHGKPSKEIICQKRVNHRVFRKKDFKWNVVKNEYSDDIYPPHCPGFAVILGRDAIPVLHNASYYIPFFWIDDVYFTGLLTARTNTRIINISRRYKSMKNTKDLVNGSAIFSYTYRTDNRLHSYWKALEDRYHFT